MKRITLLQAILDTMDAPNYLEIGVNRGNTFKAIRAAVKVGVDPTRKPAAAFGKNDSYKEMTSDAYFDQGSYIWSGEGYVDRWIDVAFVDGLHTRDQAYRDVKNCLKHLAPGGVIVLHDCNPPHAAAAIAAESHSAANAMGHPEWDGAWNGDVYRAMIDILQYLPDAFVVDSDYGLGIIENPEGAALGPKANVTVPWDIFSVYHPSLLNLKSVEYFQTWLANRRVQA